MEAFVARRATMHRLCAGTSIVAVWLVFWVWHCSPLVCEAAGHLNKRAGATRIDCLLSGFADGTIAQATVSDNCAPCRYRILPLCAMLAARNQATKRTQQT